MIKEPSYYYGLFNFYESFHIGMSQKMKKIKLSLDKNGQLTEEEHVALTGLLISDWATGRLPIYNKPFCKEMKSVVSEFCKNKRVIMQKSNKPCFDDILQTLKESYNRNHT